ncbi:hypothetical protein MNV49_004290 [Pseudohyphozyma bogoriensis]|nr:hypothetical protein MNV49_004290 [Pseudohyphozyma bogoriensis]
MFTSCTPLLFALLLLPFASAQIGTSTHNVSSDSTDFTYVSTWRSTQGSDGTYIAYSNLSDASVTFSFVGVAATYYCAAGPTRGLFLIKVDDEATYTVHTLHFEVTLVADEILQVDLYDDSGYTQPLAVAFQTPTLPYGAHNVTLLQIGRDARFGYYPYLVTEMWQETVPTNASYTATEVLTTATTGAIGSTSTSTTVAAPTSHKSDSSVGAIAGGVVGGVVALGLLGFLIYLWKRDSAKARRGGAAVLKVQKAEGGKMSIEDDTKPISGAGVDYGGYGGGVHHYGSSVSVSVDGHSRPPAHGGWGSYGGSHVSREHLSPDGSRTGFVDPYLLQHQSYPSFYSAPVTNSQSPSNDYHYSSTTHSGPTGEYSDGSQRDARAYPYHSDGSASYPVPEI